ncbi:hypothetical protein Tco_0218862 [Tanacetum coccineum]
MADDVQVNKVHVDYASLLWSDFLHYVMQKKNVIQYPRFTKLITDDLIEKYKYIPKRLEEENHTIKDDTLLVNVYTAREVMVRGIQIPNDLVTDVIRDTQVYKDYVEKYEGVEVPTIQPEPVESTQRTHRTPRATRKPNLDVVQKKKGKQGAGESSSPKTSLKIQIRKNKSTPTTSLPPIEKKIPEEDVEKLVEGEDESIGDEFADMEKLEEIVDDDAKKDDDDKHDDAKDDKGDDDDDDDDDHDDQALIRTRGTGSSEIRTEKMQTSIPLPPRSPRTDLSSDKTIAEELTGQIEEICEALREKVLQLTVSTTNDLMKEARPKMYFTATTSDLQQQLYLKLKSDLQSQVIDPELWNALKAKYEKSSASTDSCRYDAFCKRDHDE